MPGLPRFVVMTIAPFAASMPMFVFRKPQENGVTEIPRFVSMRLFFESILFLLTLKYGLSNSRPAANAVALRLVPAGVR